MTHLHLSHSVTKTLSCRETCRLSEDTFPLLPCKQKKHHNVPVPMCHAGLPQRASFFPFSFSFPCSLSKISHSMMLVSLFLVFAVSPSSKQCTSLRLLKRKHIVIVCKEMKGGWEMQRKNAVAAVGAVGGVFKSSVQCTPDKKARKKTLLFHDAVSQGTRKSGAAPAHQCSCWSYGGVRNRNVSSRNVRCWRF